MLINRSLPVNHAWNGAGLCEWVCESRKQLPSRWQRQKLESCAIHSTQHVSPATKGRAELVGTSEQEGRQIFTHIYLTCSTRHACLLATRSWGGEGTRAARNGGMTHSSSPASCALRSMWAAGLPGKGCRLGLQGLGLKGGGIFAGCVTIRCSCPRV